MLIFSKSTRGLHKNAHFFPIFLNIKYSHSFIFSTDWWQSTFSSYLCLGWLTSIVPRWQRKWRHLGTSVMDWVSRRQPLTYQIYSPGLLGSFDQNEGKMRLWTTLIKSDCAFYHKIIQIISRKSKIMLAVLFRIKRKKKCSRSQIIPKKSASTIGKSLQPTGIWLLSVPVGGKFEPCLGGVGWGVWTGNVKSFRRYTPVLGV